jgi:molecular chaperone GrpE
VTEDAKNEEDAESPDEVKAQSNPPAAEDESEGASEDAAPADPLEEAKAEAAQLKDKLIRMAADFDNFRKRSRREVSEAEKKGRDGLLNDLLPVFDNLERATSHAESTAAADDAASVKGLVDGITLVMKQFRDALGRLGIERVESVGQPFDPSVHEAIQHLETSDFEPGCIAAEVQPGYRQGERLVRPAMVVVAKAPAASSPPPSDSSDENTTNDQNEDEAASSSDSSPPQSGDGESPEA